MFSWAPPMTVTRGVHYSPKDATLEQTSRSEVSVWLIPGDPQAVPDLLRAAEQARTQAGYSETNRRYAGKVDGGDCWILCSVFGTTYAPGATQTPPDSTPVAVQIRLAAPYLEP